MTERILRAPADIAPGLTELLPPGDPGLGLSLLRLRSGATWTHTTPLESALLLLSGGVTVELDGAPAELRRDDPFEELGTVVLAPPETTVQVRAHLDAELVRVETANPDRFAPQVFRPADAFVDRRGAGGGGEAYRSVRTYFDRRNAPEQSRLVVGEVVNLPGRWSSYPPHHHAQPELYHYRFRPEHGYGHAEHGDEVFKVRHGDTLRIAPGHDHAQCAAPGYAMLYVWAIRHLEGQPYDGPTFAETHRDALHPDREPWMPEELR